FANIEARLGDSRVALLEVVAGLDQPAIFWCDAHWSTGPTSGEDMQCPLVDEIGTMRTGRSNQYVLIDDARFFTSPAAPPFRETDWPTIEEVFDALRSADAARSVIIED